MSIEIQKAGETRKKKGEGEGDSLIMNFSGTLFLSLRVPLPDLTFSNIILFMDLSDNNG